MVLFGSRVDPLNLHCATEGFIPLRVTGTSCTNTPRPQPLMELWAIFLEDSEGGRPSEKPPMNE